ncbi:MAG TPA: pyridoxal-phosphate dependent enzyme [Thermoanaerobaculia bacterium]|jgi:threonine dehydratase|nr:pyridoxal-phosphate dependent enzyme [Thermoanaerobaculia bacterium]
MLIDKQIGARVEPLPTYADVETAAARIAPYVHRTPVITSASLDRAAGASLFFKCENLQRVGAFKMRGASNAVWSLAEEEARRGVLTHSSGNHGAALARAAGQRGVLCRVVMPENAPKTKRRAVEDFGAVVVPCAPTLQAREETTARLLAETGAVLVHPYNDPTVIAGQGTAARELLHEVPDLDLVVAPIGGGGLLSGTAVATAALQPRAAVWGAEPSGADDAQRSLAAGRIVPVESPRTVADGLRATIGPLPLAILSAHAVRIATVDDPAILAAMRFFWERTKLLIEPSAAVAVAVLLEGAISAAGARVGVIVTGGNLDLPEALFQPR